MTTECGTLDQPLDLLIVGAGLSGIDLAHHVAQNFPHWSWEIHDVHDDLGGTWHTFTYPGIRSDSDMATFGFPFRPWPHKSTLGQGADIKEYIRDVARDCGAPSVCGPAPGSRTLTGRPTRSSTRSPL